MRKFFILILAILALLVLVSAVPRASAEENPIVEVWYAGAKTDYIPVPPPVTVTIKTYSSYPGVSYNVLVVKPDGSTDTVATGVPPGAWYNFDYTCYQSGWYEAKAGPVGTRYCVQPFFVIPEIPLGTIAVLLTCFTAASLKHRKLY